MKSGSGGDAVGDGAIGPGGPAEAAVPADLLGAFEPVDEVRARMGLVKWAETSVGPPATWSRSLRTVLRLLLDSRFAMWLGWGPELTFFYNDTYRRDTLGLKHPWALGAPAAEVWAEVWDDVAERVTTVVEQGQATWDEALLLFLERNGYLEETYHTFSYLPVRDDDGTIGGLLCVVAEETDRVVGERRLRTLAKLAGGLAAARTRAEVFAATAEAVATNERDLPFSLVYVFDEHGDATLAGSSGVPAGHPLAPATVPAAALDERWGGPRGPRIGAPVTVDLSAVEAPLPTGAWDRPASQAVLVAMAQQGQDEPAGFVVAGVNPFRPLDGDYLDFVELIAGQVAAALANASSYDAERRRVQVLAELDRAKTTFFSNVSHELRTPLTLLLSPVEELLAGAGGDLSAVQNELATLVHRNALRLQRLVNTLLEFVRIEAGRAEPTFLPTDLAAFTADLAAAFRSPIERAGLELVVDCPPLGEPVAVDAGMWEKIVLNLLSNAFKFTHEGRITVRLDRRGPDAQLTVTDTGVGIPADEQRLLFDRFHRVRGVQGRTQEGTGIGLALVRELVHIHGGDITVQSEPGVGTTLTVTVPRHRDEGDGAGRPDGPTAPNAVGDSTTVSTSAAAFVEEAMRWLPDDMRSVMEETVSASDPHRVVLVVDDNADMRTYLARLLGRHWTVRLAADGVQALAQARAETPDLVISDVMMPNLDGFGLLQAIRHDRHLQHVPVLLLSARAGQEAAIEGLDAGADDYLTKPFTSAELLARVRSHITTAQLRLERAQDAERHVARLQELASIAVELNEARSTAAVVDLLTERARLLIGARQASTTLMGDGDPAEIQLRHVSTAPGHEPSSTAGQPADGALDRHVLGSRQPRRVPGLLAAPMHDSTGRALGVIRLDDRDGGDFSAEDEAALVQLTQIAAARIENARRFDREHTVARTLQESMLPATLPATDVLDVAWAYLPATEDLAIGGDWYDVVPVGPDRYAVVIGDVVGHGVDAAATMGQLRNALRAHLIDGAGPGDALDRLAHLAAVIGLPGFATVFCAVLDTAAGTLRWSNAGHPPPLLRRVGGGADFLDTARSVPIGVTVEAAHRHDELTLEPGDTLLLYTDGLVDRKGSSIIDELDRLQQTVARPAAATADAAALLALVAAAHVPADRPDDIALVSLRLVEGPDPR
jgi:signal transduction histidine kinase/serine phosphatase RsbU (regulator of sigma subunit)/DNA-binding response OmpR family regulator